MASESFAQRHPVLWPGIIAAVMLAAAVGPWPYGYYKLQRWVVALAGVYVAWQGVELERIWAAWVFGLVVLLFNPILPVHLTRETWAPIDITAAALFVAAIFLVRMRKGGG